MTRVVIAKLLQYLFRFGRGGIRLFSGGLIFIRKSGLWLPLVFILSVVPQLLGSFAYLQQQGLPWYFAAVGSIGVEFGGAIFTVYNTLTQLAVPNVHPGYAAMLLAGVFSSIITLVWFVYVWLRLNRTITPTMGLAHVVLLGGLFLGMTFVTTLVIDVHVLPGTATRVSGMTYFLENPGESVEPIRFVVGEYVLSPESDVSVASPVNLTTTGNVSNATG